MPTMTHPTAPNNSFDDLRQSRASSRGVIVAGIVVLIVALAGAIVAGVIAFNREPAPQADLVAGTASASVVAPPAGAEELVGTYAGQLRGQQAQWPAVIALAGGEGLVAYPDNGCQVYLYGAHPHGETIRFQAQALTSCEAPGTWEFQRTDRGILAAYSEDGAVIASGDLDRSTPPA